MWLGKLIMLDMTLIGWLSRKTSKQTKTITPDHTSPSIFEFVHLITSSDLIENACWMANSTGPDQMSPAAQCPHPAAQGQKHVGHNKRLTSMSVNHEIQVKEVHGDAAVLIAKHPAVNTLRRESKFSSVKRWQDKTEMSVRDSKIIGVWSFQTIFQR